VAAGGRPGGVRAGAGRGEVSSGTLPSLSRHRLCPPPLHARTHSMDMLRLTAALHREHPNHARRTQIWIRNSSRYQDGATCKLIAARSAPRGGGRS
jgi:hypothetical protein